MRNNLINSMPNHQKVFKLQNQKELYIYNYL